jgi:hypothetical protein
MRSNIHLVVSISKTGRHKADYIGTDAAEAAGKYAEIAAKGTAERVLWCDHLGNATRKLCKPAATAAREKMRAADAAAAEHAAATRKERIAQLDFATLLVDADRRGLVVDPATAEKPALVDALFAAGYDPPLAAADDQALPAEPEPEVAAASLGV